MKARAYIPDQDYVEIATWWVDRTGIIPSQELLSDDGVIVETDEGVPLAFVSVYGLHEGERLAILGFPATNPAPGFEFNTHAALNLAVKTACSRAAALGLTYVVAWTDIKAVDDVYQKAGFSPASRGTLTDYYRKLR